MKHPIAQETGRMLILISVLLMAHAQDLFACSCRPNPPLCESFFQSSDIFTGTVVGFSQSTETFRGIPVGYRQYKIKVEQTFRGSAAGDVVVRTGLNIGDCGYDFHVGNKYVVFSSGPDEGKQLATNRCTMTAAWSKEFEKRIKEQAASKETTARLFGNVFDREGNSAPLKDVTIVLDAKGTARRAISDEHGYYQFNSVPPGEHTLEIVSPMGHSINSSKPIHVAASGCFQMLFLATRTKTKIGNPK